MVDFVRIHFQDKENLENHICKLGNFHEVETVYEMHSTQIRYPYRTMFYGMEIGVSKSRGYVKNSLHKAYYDYSNGIYKNYSDFTYSQLCETIDLVSNKIVDLDKATLSQLEFGLNIRTHVSAESIITQNVFMNKLKSHSHNRKFKGEGELKQFDFHNYCVKIYDKDKQYNVGHHLLRFEVRLDKAKELQRLGVFHLNDLKCKYLLRKLFLNLIKRFDEMVIVDSYSKEDISAKDYASLANYNNPMYWSRLLEEMKYQTKMNHHKKYIGLLENYQLLTTKKLLKELLINKFIYLINH